MTESTVPRLNQDTEHRTIEDDQLSTSSGSSDTSQPNSYYSDGSTRCCISNDHDLSDYDLIEGELHSPKSEQARFDMNELQKVLQSDVSTAILQSNLQEAGYQIGGVTKEQGTKHKSDDKIGCPKVKVLKGTKHKLSDDETEGPNAKVLKGTTEVTGDEIQTALKISSGRGVGLDTLEQNVEQLGYAFSGLTPDDVTLSTVTSHGMSIFKN